MSQAASQATAFYSDVARTGLLWTIRDAGGFPAPRNADGARVQPFWSSLSRARAIVDTVPAYSGFTVVELSWADFAARCVPGLDRDGLLVGVNWTGPRAAGYDVPPRDVVANVEAARGSAD